MKRTPASVHSSVLIIRIIPTRRRFAGARLQPCRLERPISWLYRLLKNSLSDSFASGHDFEACPERSRRVPISPLFLMFRADFSPRGTCLSDFFSNLFSRAAPDPMNIGL